MKPPVEQAKFWCDPALANTEMLRATYVTHAFSLHTHEGYAIGVIESGGEVFSERWAAHAAVAGSIVIIHPGEVHTGHAGVPEGWSYRMLYPGSALIQKAATEVQESFQGIPFFANPVIYDVELANQLRRMHRALEISESPLEGESRFLWTLAQLITRHASDRPFPTPIKQEHLAVQQTQTFLKTHYAETISLEQLAQQVNLKPLRLLRVFQRELGLPPHTYLVQVRVAQAKKLLALGVPIAQAAYDTGFTDQSHLHRHFKRLVGITPKQYADGFRLQSTV